MRCSASTALYKKSVYPCFLKQVESSKLEVLIRKSQTEDVSENVDLPHDDVLQRETLEKCLERIIREEVKIYDYKRKHDGFLGPFSNPQYQTDGTIDNPIEEAYVVVCEAFGFCGSASDYHWVSCKQLNLGQEVETEFSDDKYDPIKKMIMMGCQEWWRSPIRKLYMSH